MEKKGIIVIPYRDRVVHLACLLLYLQRYFNSNHIDILVVEQGDNEKWNKGLLFNAAYKDTVVKRYDYMICHDVDFIPAKDVDYSYTKNPTLLSTECSQFNYGQYYPTFFGGVVGVSKKHYEAVNGFSNSFRGYGGEDDQFFRRFVEKGIKTYTRSGNRFENFVHPKPDVRPGTEFFKTPDYQNNLRLATGPIDFSDGLSSAKYEVMSREFQYGGNYYLKIKTN